MNSCLLLTQCIESIYFTILGTTSAVGVVLKVINPLHVILKD